MASLWRSAAVLELGDGLVNFESINPPGLCPLFPGVPSNNRDALPDSPGWLDLLVSCRNHSQTAIVCPDPAQKTLFHTGVCQGITKVHFVNMHKIVLIYQESVLVY